MIAVNGGVAESYSYGMQIIRKITITYMKSWATKKYANSQAKFTYSLSQQCFQKENILETSKDIILKDN